MLNIYTYSYEDLLPASYLLKMKFRVETKVEIAWYHLLNKDGTD